MVRPITGQVTFAEDKAKGLATREVGPPRVLGPFRLLLLVVPSGREARGVDAQVPTPSRPERPTREVQPRIGPVPVAPGPKATPATPPTAARLRDTVALGRVVAPPYQTGHGAGRARVVLYVRPETGLSQQAADDRAAGPVTTGRRVDAVAETQVPA